MKIGILTFHCAINYGAILQTYGLQEYLKSLGHEVYVLDYRPKYLQTPYKLFHWEWIPSLSIVSNLLFFVREILVFPTRMKRKIKFNKFTYKYIHLHSLNCINSESDFDAFVFGSDQIWNPNITEKFDKLYFGLFEAAKNKRLIAYAASSGSIDSLLTRKKEFIELLSSYTAISVRERSIANFISTQLPQKKVITVVDPVFLAGRNTFEAIASTQIAQKRYLLVFQLYYDMTFTCRKIAEKIADTYGLQIIEMLSFTESLKHKEFITTASPENFVSLFKNASYIVTSSYHGMVFSLLFEKDFNVVYSSVCERMINLLSELNLKERLVYDENNITLSPIDYTSVNKRLENMRSISKLFINKSLS